MPENSKIADENWQRFRRALDAGHSDFLRKAKKCDDFFIGDQWSAADREALDKAGRPALTFNKIISTISNVLGTQIMNRTETVFRPSTGGDAGVAEALSKVWRHISQSNDLDWLRTEVFSDGIIRGRGFFDVRMDFDSSMLGEVRITNINSKNVIIDPDADQYDPTTWAEVFVTKWMSPMDIEVLYSKADADILRHRGNNLSGMGFDTIEQYRERFGGEGVNVTNAFGSVDAENGNSKNIRVIERQYRVLSNYNHFLDTVNGDTYPVPDGWDEARIAQQIASAPNPLVVFKKLAKRVRWTVTADNCVLHDDWSPYPHFTIIPYFPHFRHGKAVGLVENLIGSQELLNKVSSQELAIVNSTSNGGYILKKGSLRNMSIDQLEMQGAKTGLVIEVDNIGDIEKLKPNQTPTGLDRISYKADEAIKGISGVTDSMMGADRADVSGKAVGIKQQVGSTNLVRVMDNLSRSDTILARTVLTLIQDYYTEPRLLHITQDGLTNTTEAVEVNAPQPDGSILNDLTLGKYIVTVATTPSREVMEDTQFDQARMLVEMGLPIPPEVLIGASRLTNRAELVRNLQAASASPEQQKFAQLEQALKEAQLAKLQAEAQHLSGRTQLDGAKVQTEGAKAQALVNEVGQRGLAQQGNPEKDQADAMFKQQELDIRRMDVEGKLATKQAELRMELEMRKQELALEAKARDEVFAQQVAMKKLEHQLAQEQDEKREAKEEEAEYVKTKTTSVSEKPAAQEAQEESVEQIDDRLY